MTLIILALLAAVLVGLNCFYNLSGLFSLVMQEAGVRFVKADSDKRDLSHIYEEKDYVFADDDFDK